MEELDIRSTFGVVDSTEEPGSFVRYLDHTGSLEFIRTLKRRSYQQLGVREGAHILDVGCGTGEDVRGMAQVTGSRGLVVGIDYSEAMVGEARKRSEGSDLPVRFEVGDVHSLHFEDNTFDGCRAERVFIHLAEPRKALSELVRVTRPGGRIVVMDADWDTFIIDAPDRRLTRKIRDMMGDSVRNGWIARQMPGMMREAGLANVGVDANAVVFTSLALVDQLVQLRLTVQQAREAGEISPEEAGAWLAELERRDAEGRFFCASIGFIISGQKV